MAVGRHAIADIYNCNCPKMDDLKYIKNLVMTSAKEAKLTVVDNKFYKFNPIGISGVLILSESHLTIHTWPEYNYIAVDVFTCGAEINPVNACKIIAKNFDSKSMMIREFERGDDCE